MGVIPSGPMEANRGVRARVHAAWKALEGYDRQIEVLELVITCRMMSLKGRKADSNMSDAVTVI